MGRTSDQGKPMPKKDVKQRTRHEGHSERPAEGENKATWTEVESMRPTQGSVGYIEVALKMRELSERAKDPKGLRKYLKGHPIPAVLGPDGRMYLTDHHHMGLALRKLSERWDAGEGGAGENPFRKCSFKVVADYSDRPDLSLRAFFGQLESIGLCHPYDGNGARVPHPAVALERLEDDPYRSLAGLARKAGAYDKENVPYAEFKWADFLRGKVPASWICPGRLPDAIHEACLLARSPLAKGLPGYKGSMGPGEKATSIDDIRERIEGKFGAADEGEMAWASNSSDKQSPALGEKLALRRSSGKPPQDGHKHGRSALSGTMSA